MSNKLMLTKFALSTALLVSIVANPAISNAANTTKNTQYETLQKTISNNALEGAQIATVVNNFSNPIDLAKKYAPDTVEDWTKTLALYEKMIGSFQTNVVTTVEGVNVDLEGSEYITLTSTPVTKSTLASANSTEQLINATSAEEVVSLDGTTSILSTDSVPTINMGKAEILMDKANDPHLAFFKAQIELEEAVESKDTKAITQSLSTLLEQYKTQISQSEKQ